MTAAPKVTADVEAVARALVKTHYVKMGARKHADLEMLAEKWWPDFVGDANGAIAALDAAGFEVRLRDVPVLGTTPVEDANNPFNALSPADRESARRLNEALNEPANCVIDGLRFVVTCDAFPEQYDVFDGEKKVAYIRLRHGDLSVHVPGPGGKPVLWNKEDEGVGGGMFNSSELRATWLKKAAEAIRANI